MAKAKVHPNNPVYRNPAFAEHVFNVSCKPASWLAVALRLRASADAIFRGEMPAATRYWDEFKRVSNLAASGTAPPEETDFDEAKFPHPNFDAGFMLLAFAAENLLKGLMVAKGIATFTNQELPQILKSHDLHKLHKNATTATTVSPHALDLLTYMAEWRARYPMPTSVDKFWPMRDDGTPTGASYPWPDPHKEHLAYLNGLEAELRKLL